MDYRERIINALEPYGWEPVFNDRESDYFFTGYVQRRYTNNMLLKFDCILFFRQNDLMVQTTFSHSNRVFLVQHINLSNEIRNDKEMIFTQTDNLHLTFKELIDAIENKFILEKL